jgi:hypothetical protein
MRLGKAANGVGEIRRRRQWWLSLLRKIPLCYFSTLFFRPLSQHIIHIRVYTCQLPGDSVFLCPLPLTFALKLRRLSPCLAPHIIHFVSQIKLLLCFFLSPVLLPTRASEMRAKRQSASPRERLMIANGRNFSIPRLLSPSSLASRQHNYPRKIH